MKNLILILVLSFLALASCSTNRGVQAAFNEYSGVEGVTSVTIPGWVIRTGAIFGDLDPNERKFLRKIHKFKVLNVEDRPHFKDVDFHREFYNRIQRTGNFDELVKVRDGNDDISILCHSKEKEVRELIILVSGDENTLVYLNGHFDLLEIKNMMEDKSVRLITSQI